MQKHEVDSFNYQDILQLRRTDGMAGFSGHPVCVVTIEQLLSNDTIRRRAHWQKAKQICLGSARLLTWCGEKGRNCGLYLMEVQKKLDFTKDTCVDDRVKSMLK